MLLSRFDRELARATGRAILVFLVVTLSISECGQCGQSGQCVHARLASHYVPMIRYSAHQAPIRQSIRLAKEASEC
jgi:hypothetical protein